MVTQNKLFGSCCPVDYSTDYKRPCRRRLEPGMGQTHLRFCNHSCSFIKPTPPLESLLSYAQLFCFWSGRLWLFKRQCTLHRHLKLPLHSFLFEPTVSHLLFNLHKDMCLGIKKSLECIPYASKLAIIASNSATTHFNVPVSSICIIQISADAQAPCADLRPEPVLFYLFELSPTYIALVFVDPTHRPIHFSLPWRTFPFVPCPVQRSWKSLLNDFAWCQVLWPPA